jgi:dihydropyrimidinase
MDYTPFDGMSVTGWPVIVLSGGRVVYENGIVSAEPGSGRFLKRDRFRLDNGLTGRPIS